MQQKPLHVLVVATWYPLNEDKLLGIYHRQFCQALAEKGVKVNMLHVDRRPISEIAAFPFSKKRTRIAENGFTTYVAHMLNRSRISEAMQIKAYARTLEKLYKEYEKEHGKPDVLHAQVLIPAGYATVMLGKKIGVPVIITEHAGCFDRFFSGWYAPFTRIATQGAKKVTCVGQYMKDWLENRFDTPAQILPNIVDCSLFSGPKAQKQDDTLEFATVCALRTGKRIHNAVDALAKLRKENRLRNFHYTVVGDGEMFNWYKNATEQSGMSDCVTFVGRKSHEEIAEILSRTDILIMPSDVESFAIPAVEAVAAGVPVVSTRCGGPEGFLTPDCSELCDVGDIEGMADAIERLANRLSELDESKIRAVAAPFSKEAVVNLAMAMYEEIISQ